MRSTEELSCPPLAIKKSKSRRESDCSITPALCANYNVELVCTVLISLVICGRSNGQQRNTSDKHLHVMLYRYFIMFT